MKCEKESEKTPMYMPVCRSRRRRRRSTSVGGSATTVARPSVCHGRQYRSHHHHQHWHRTCVQLCVWEKVWVFRYSAVVTKHRRRLLHAHNQIDPIVCVVLNRRDWEREREREERKRIGMYVDGWKTRGFKRFWFRSVSFAHKKMITLYDNVQQATGTITMGKNGCE